MDFGHQWNLVEPAMVFWSRCSVQHRFATAEPTPEQVAVAEAALEACLALEQA